MANRVSLGSMEKIKDFFNDWVGDFFKFVGVFFGYVVKKYLMVGFFRFESVKSVAVVKMYQQRGKYADLFVHGGLVALMTIGVALGPSLLTNEAEARSVVSMVNRSGSEVAGLVEEDGRVLGMAMAAEEVQPLTVVSDKPRAEIFDYEVQEGDTLGTIADKFGVSIDTIRWANPDDIKTEKTVIKPGQTVKIPPVTGVMHKVKSGETVYSVAKKYGISAQAIVDFPFNEFSNDETFALAIGQSLVIPDGVVPDVKPWSPTSSLARVMTPDAGSVSATGSWIWPTSGSITQRFYPWHKGLDIANKSGGVILAADSGVVVMAGWPDNVGYGNRILIDHGNGYQTLYAHLSKVSVQPGQAVNRGNVIGTMGSTGRSTGVHLHFEIRSSSGNINPLSVLK